MQPTAPACFLLELAQFWTICLSPVGLLCAPICLVHSGLVLSQLAYRFGPGNPCLPLPSWPANCLLVHSLPSSSVGQPDACWCPVLLLGQPTACWCTVCPVPPLASQMPAGAQFCSVGQPNVCWCTNCPDCGATSLSTHQSGPLDLYCPEISLFPRSLHMEGTYLLRRKFWIFGRKLGRCYKQRRRHDPAS
ncbi:hypothetical protein MANES_S010464v8 [Manihot esculenta]|uniref:Uncharacterized protein n=1 Tax=Manihot esculenta TaxID=3983 RepID=A0ACB7FV13_MANES|nr:hypothetical protein MANES_S010464v8 [Manihot esculenta]